MTSWKWRYWLAMPSEPHCHDGGSCQSLRCGGSGSVISAPGSTAGSPVVIAPEYRSPMKRGRRAIALRPLVVSQVRRSDCVVGLLLALAEGLLRLALQLLRLALDLLALIVGCVADLATHLALELLRCAFGAILRAARVEVLVSHWSLLPQ